MVLGERLHPGFTNLTKELVDRMHSMNSSLCHPYAGAVQEEHARACAPPAKVENDILDDLFGDDFDQPPPANPTPQRGITSAASQSDSDSGDGVDVDRRDQVAVRGSRSVSART